MSKNSPTDISKPGFTAENTPVNPPVNPENAAGSGQEPAKSSPERDVLSAEEARELAPLYSDVVLALKQVYDPEIPVNIYDLGLIYELYIDRDHRVSITMTFTAPTCPLADEVVAEVQRSVEDVPGVSDCHIELVFEPAWDQSMLSDEARIELGLD